MYGSGPPVVRTQSKASSKAFLAEQQDRADDEMRRRVRAREARRRFVAGLRSLLARFRRSGKA